MVTRVEQTVTDVAHMLAELYLEAGHAKEAAMAARKG